MTATDPVAIARRRTLVAMKRRGGERTRAKLAGKQVRIWSGEHSAWWRPGAAGYTTHQDAAGIYPFEDAWSHTSHCDRDKRIAFEVVQAEDNADGK